MERGGDIEFECKQLEGEQNSNAQLQRGEHNFRFQCTCSEEGEQNRSAQLSRGGKF